MDDRDQLQLPVDPSPAPGRWEIRTGDCLALLRDLPEASVDSIVTDPPAGIAFMGKEWDRDRGGRDQWIAWMAAVARECLRVIRPGGHALVWALPRTSHWTATAWEDAGWEPRDRIAHCFGSGFPKGNDIGKAIDREMGLERPRVPGGQGGENTILGSRKSGEAISGEAISGEAKRWTGWNTAMKPAVEDWWLFRAPLAERTVAANVRAHGVGGLNIDGCRVEGSWERNSMTRCDIRGGRTVGGDSGGLGCEPQSAHPQGRWPANLIHDGSAEVRACFPECKTGGPGITKENHNGCTMSGPASNKTRETIGYDDSGSAARFFQQCADDDPEDAATRLIYVPKASRSDRDEGCEEIPARKKNEVYGDGLNTATKVDAKLHTQEGMEARPFRHNTHETVKPTALMRYLVRLVTPPGGLVLDPFMGSGSTGKAALLEGFRFLGIEREAEYVRIAEARLAHAAEVAGRTRVRDKAGS